jgi:hypothetical protein
MRISGRSLVAAVVVCVAVVALAPSGLAQLGDTFTNWAAHPAIAYASRPVSDPVARLNVAIREGRTRLQF